MAGVELGTAYISLLPSTSKFVPQMKGVFDSAGGVAKSSGEHIRSVSHNEILTIRLRLPFGLTCCGAPHVELHQALIFRLPRIGVWKVCGTATIDGTPHTVG